MPMPSGRFPRSDRLPTLPRRHPLALSVSALLLSGALAGQAQAFPPVLNLGSLNGSNGFSLDGAAANDRSGSSVAAAGDINGDGLDDLIVGAFYADPNGNGYAGSSYVVFGKSTAFTQPLALSGLNGSNGFRIDGAAANDRSGFSVAAAGDINGDGLDDLIVGARGADPNGNGEAGSSYVIFGKSTAFAAVVPLSGLNGSDGFRLDGAAASDYSGFTVAAAGDINGDGLDDLIVGAPGADPNGNNGTGSSYVVFGKSTAFAQPLALSGLNGSDGFRLDGAAAGELSSFSVAAAGDINGDGLDDLIVGAPAASPNGNSFAGSSYVVFGKPTAFAAVVPLSGLNGSDGFRLDGAAAGDYAGFSVAAAGDINGDGLDDLIVGAHYADPNGNSSAGSSYVVFGQSAAFPPTLALSSLNGGNGFRLDGAATNDFSGRSVAAAGDINDDGLDDLIVGAFGADPNLSGIAGSSYVLFGKSTAFAAVVPLSGLNGSDGFRLDGAAAGDQSGQSVAVAGDINGDGLGDLIVGAPGADPISGSNAGRSYVLFGFAPLLGINPGSLAFGNVTVGQTSPAQTVTLSNPGRDDLIFGSLALSGANAGDFGLAADGCSGQTVVPAASCNFAVTLRPGATGARSAQVDIPSNAASSPDALPVSGDGVQAQIVLAPDPLAFGTIAVGQTSAVQTVTLNNPGSAVLNVSALDAAIAPFAQTGGSCGAAPFSVPVAGSCTLSYQFSPTASGAASQTFTATSDATPGNDNQFTLQGTGTLPGIVINPASLAFGNVMVGQTSAAQTVVIDNTGSADLVLGALALGGASAGEFLLGNDGCSSQTVAPTASCSFDVRFVPGVANAATAQVDIPSNAPSSPDAVALSGNGMAAAIAVPGLSALGLGLLGVLLGWIGGRRVAVVR